MLNANDRTSAARRGARPDGSGSVSHRDEARPRSLCPAGALILMGELELTAQKVIFRRLDQEDFEAVGIPQDEFDEAPRLAFGRVLD